jgi:hypothetical protein
MDFKANLLQKIQIDRLAARVIASVSAGPDSTTRIDKAAMRTLLEMAGWKVRRERDLELYLPPDDRAGTVLVLDNDLPLYRTTVADVALRKSPTVKEMVSIRNVIRILNDGDVVIGKKAATVAGFQAAAIAKLDLRYDADDIAAIALDGAASLESRYAEGVLEALELLAELLGYVPPPRVLASDHHYILGHLASQGGALRYGPLVVFSRIHNRLGFIDRPLDPADEADAGYFQQVLQGRAKVAAEGPAAFKALAAAVPPSGAKDAPPA